MNCIKLDDAAREELINGLDARSRMTPVPLRNRRRHPRFAYRYSDVRVIVSQPLGQTLRLRVCTRDISAGGVAFLHGQFLHAGSPCRITLPRLDGAIHAAKGMIATCRLIEGHVHLVGVRLEREIDPADFVDVNHAADDDLKAAAAVMRMRQVVEQCVRELESQLSHMSLDRAMALCTQLYEAAKAMGSQALATNARLCAGSLQAAGSVERAAWHLRRLVEACLCSGAVLARG